MWFPEDPLLWLPPLGGRSLLVPPFGAVCRFLGLAPSPPPPPQKKREASIWREVLLLASFLRASSKGFKPAIAQLPSQEEFGLHGRFGGDPAFVKSQPTKGCLN